MRNIKSTNKITSENNRIKSIIVYSFHLFDFDKENTN